MKPLVVLLLVAGCGFHAVDVADAGDGGAADDLATNMNDSDGADLAGADLAGSLGPGDLAMVSKYGAGPLGALPSGYCCTADDVCRSRRCMSYGPTSSGCSDPCTYDGDCNVGPIMGLMCDLTTGVCVPANTSGACLAESVFTWGNKQMGDCCDAFAATPGAECEGGWCISVGSSNPAFCTQGCDDASPCPSGYGCRLQGGGSNHPGVCVLTASLTDPNSVYGCH
jgi:hypothetical protein